MLLFGGIYGSGDYATVSPSGSRVASHLGLRNVGLAMRLSSGGHALGGALWACLGGDLFDVFSRYSEMWWFAFATAILAGVLVYLLKDDRPTRSITPAATGAT